MNRPRDPQGRYIKSKLDLSNKVPSDLFGGRNIPLINSAVIKSKSDLSNKVPSNLFGGRNVPLIKSADRY
jgi:hypothetical protein